MEQSKVKQSAGYVIPPDRLICVSCNSIGNWVGFMAFSFLFEGEVISCTVLLEVSEYLMLPTFSPALFFRPLPFSEKGATPLPTFSPLFPQFFTHSRLRDSFSDVSMYYNTPACHVFSQRTPMNHELPHGFNAMSRN